MPIKIYIKYILLIFLVIGLVAIFNSVSAQQYNNKKPLPLPPFSIKLKYPENNAVFYNTNITFIFKPVSYHPAFHNKSVKCNIYINDVKHNKRPLKIKIGERFLFNATVDYGTNQSWYVSCKFRRFKNTSEIRYFSVSDNPLQLHPV